MEFPDCFIQLIMGCITYVSYSLLIQGCPLGLLTPTQGLRQGNPLSSYLFLLVTEGFSSSLQKANQDSRVFGVSIVPFAPSLNHLFFANDTLLFCDAEFTQIMELKRLFSLYEATSRQQINFAKFAIYFSPSNSESPQAQLQALPVFPCHE
ncbi:hypothetical protein PRUPE_1G096300 [Prunus persica]|uniref:Uncharacterized protein n=1 Tax=Prunus persica TaxID=3760 RepID=A0A251QVX6_PRUPE|nr:hypothetical protein PRUPE_1G096300 [Prunus persica]